VAIAMLASVKPFNQSFTEFLIAALLFLFAVLLLRTRPYNYQRALAYHLVFLLLTFWSVLLTASFRFFDGIIVVSLMFIGAGVLAAVGVLVIDKLPKELANSKVVEIHQLFRMLFSKASVYEVKTSDSGLMVTSQQAENKDKTFGNVSLMKIGEVLHKSANVNY
jgi:predicted membrane protein